MTSPTHTPDPVDSIGRGEEDRLDRLENVALSPAALWARDAGIMLAYLLPVAGVGGVALLVGRGVCFSTN